MSRRSIHDGIFVVCLNEMLDAHQLYTRRGQSKAGRRMGVESKVNRTTMGVNAHLRAGLDAHGVGEDPKAITRIQEATAWTHLTQSVPLSRFNSAVSRAYIAGVESTNDYSRKEKKRQRSALHMGLAEYLGLLARLEREFSSQALS